MKVSNVLKKVLLGALVVVIIAIGSVSYIMFRGVGDVVHLIKDRLETLVTEGSNGLYQLHIGRLKVDIPRNRVEVSNVRLEVDSTRFRELERLEELPDQTYSILLKRLVVEGVDPKNLLSRTVSLNVIRVENSDVHVYRKKRAYNPEVKDTLTLYDRIAKEVGSFAAQGVLVSDLKVTYHNLDRRTEKTNRGKANLRFDDILIDSTTQYDRSRFLFARDALVTVTDYSLPTTDGLYDFHVDSFILNAGKRLMHLHDVRLKPRLSPDAFFRRLDHFDNRFEISCANAEIRNVEWAELMADENFIASNVILNGLEFEVRADKRRDLPRKNKLGKYPHQMLMNLPFPIQLDSVQLNQALIRYIEHPEHGSQEGVVTFNQINGLVRHVSNIPESIAVHHAMTLSAHARFLNTPLRADLSFDMRNAQGGHFIVDAELGEFDGTKLNPILIPLAMVEIEHVNVRSVKMDLRGDNYQCDGRITLLYDNLKMEILKEKEGEALKQRKLLSFLAERVFMKEENTLTDKNPDPKVVSYQRDTEKGLFNLIWKTVFEGIRETIQGTKLDQFAEKMRANAAAADSTKHHKEKKERKKKHGKDQ